MRIIAFIEEAVIKKILSHLNLWLPQYHDPPDYCHIPAAPPTVVYQPACAAEACGYQLNMFSDRSYERWEAGSKSNSGTRAGNRKGNNTDSRRDYAEDYANCSSSFDNNNSDCKYLHPYEDEFSQVFYDD